MQDFTAQRVRDRGLNRDFASSGSLFVNKLTRVPGRWRLQGCKILADQSEKITEHMDPRWDEI